MMNNQILLRVLSCALMVLFVSQSALALSDEDFLYKSDKYVVTDSSVFVYPHGNDDGYYRVYDFPTKRIFIVVPGTQEPQSFPHDSKTEREFTFILRTVCSKIPPRSDFKRFC